MTEALISTVEQSVLPDYLKEDISIRFRSELEEGSIELTPDELAIAHAGVIEAGRTLSEGRDITGLFGFSLQKGRTPNEFQVVHRNADGRSITAGVRSEITATGAREVTLFQVGRSN